MKRIVQILLLLLLSYGAIRPLLNSEYFTMHDDTQVARVIEMGRALKEGQFPVRWVADLGYGYGYPIFNFYGPLPYYVGGFLYFAGVPALIATKVMFGLGIVLPAILLYAVLTSIVSWPAAFVGATVYLYAPYHAVEIYVRGAVGEYWILSFWPLLFYSLYWMNDKKKKSQVVIAGTIGLAGSILSHTLLGYATLLFLIFGLIFFRRIPRWFWMGLGLSAFFWLPALVEMKYTNVSAQVSDTANYHDHFVCFSQLWSSLWGFGGSTKGCISDGMSFMLGKIHLVIAGIASVVWLVRLKGRTEKKLFAIGVICLTIGAFFTLSISEPIWNILPLFQYMQYPWRFLSLAEFGLSLMAAYLVSTIENVWKKVVIAGIIVCSVCSMNAKWFVPQYSYDKKSSAFETKEDLRWRVSRISDEYLSADVSRPRQVNQIISDTIVSDQSVKIHTVVDNVIEKEYVVESTIAAALVVNVAYFPGWEYQINRKVVKPDIVSGLPRLEIGVGQSIIHIQFKNTIVREIGNIVSGAIVFGCIIWYAKQKIAKR